MYFIFGGIIKYRAVTIGKNIKNWAELKSIGVCLQNVYFELNY
jgi:hypothetical protein